MIDQLAVALAGVLPAGYRCERNARWITPSGHTFTSALMVRRGRQFGALTRTPALVVELRDGFLARSAEYMKSGLRHLWLVEPEPAGLAAMYIDDLAPHVRQTVTADSPAEVDFGIASVRIDLGELLAS